MTPSPGQNSTANTLCITCPENFICLNETSHSMVHFLRDSAHGWRYAIMALIKIMKHMDRIAAQKQAKELAKERAVA